MCRLDWLHSGPQLDVVGAGCTKGKHSRHRVRSFFRVERGLNHVLPWHRHLQSGLQACTSVSPKSCRSHAPCCGPQGRCSWYLVCGCGCAMRVSHQSVSMSVVNQSVIRILQEAAAGYLNTPAYLVCGCERATRVSHKDIKGSTSAYRTIADVI